MKNVLARMANAMNGLNDPYSPPEVKVEEAIRLASDASLMAAFFSGWQYERLKKEDGEDPRPFDMPYEVGDVVVATGPIVEGDVRFDPAAAMCENGWLHACKGDVGDVVFIEPYIKKTKDINHGLPTVRFRDTGTATTCLMGEIKKKEGE